MASTFYLEILTPERKFFMGEAEIIVIKTPQGEMGIMPNHVPMVVAVDIGPLLIKMDGKWKEAVLTEGFCEITHEKTVLHTDTAEWPEEIDENRAKAAKVRAEERLQRSISKMEFIRSRAAVARAMARLKVKGHIK